MTTTSGSAAISDGRQRIAAVPAMDLGRIELARGGGALAHHLVVRRGIDAAPMLPRQSPRPMRRAVASARLSHHRPKPSMMIDATMPRPGAANGVVPKNGIGIAFWIDGVPGKADMVKVEVPSMMAAGISRRGTAGRAKKLLRHRSRAQRTQRTG